MGPPPAAPESPPGVTLSALFFLRRLFLSQDPFLAEMLQNNKDQIMCYHEHDSLLDHKEEEELSEEERKAAWAEYEAEKKVGRGKSTPLLSFCFLWDMKVMEASPPPTYTHTQPGNPRF